MRRFALCVICSKREPMVAPKEMPLLQMVLEIRRDPKHLGSMWVVLVAFTTKIKRSTTYLLHPTPKLVMLL
jgi:hypothetical protein